MIKRLKKELQINIEEKEGQLYLGNKDKDMRLVMLRPNEIMEFCEFAGTNAEDILIWVGKSLGKIFMEKFFSNKDWSSEVMATKKEVVLGTLEVMMLMGYGMLILIFFKYFNEFLSSKLMAVELLSHVTPHLSYALSLHTVSEEVLF